MQNSHKSLAQDGFFGVMLLYNLFDIFMVMYLGNEIELSSNRLSHCLYESNWIEQTEKCKKYIMIVTEVVKRPRELTVGKLYPLNLQTFSCVSTRELTILRIVSNHRIFQTY